VVRVSVRRRRNDGKELPGRGKVLPGTPPLLEWRLVGGRLRLRTGLIHQRRDEELTGVECRRVNPPRFARQ
jgi:hypothetical protein